MISQNITTAGERAEGAVNELKKQVEELSKRLDKVEADIARLQRDFTTVRGEVISQSGAWQEGF